MIDTALHVLAGLHCRFAQERLLSRNHTNGSEYLATRHPAGRAIMYDPMRVFVVCDTQWYEHPCSPSAIVRVGMRAPLTTRQKSKISSNFCAASAAWPRCVFTFTAGVKFRSHSKTARCNSRLRARSKRRRCCRHRYCVRSRQLTMVFRK